MANQHTFEEKGKVQPKPVHEEEAPQKAEGPVTVSDMEGKLNAETLTRMQQTVGNAAVQRFLAQRNAEGSSEVDEETASTINSKRGAGQALDESVASKAGGAMGHDFSGVNVHADSQSDQMNKKLGAKAFTTGSDIFFKEGAYNPSSSEGQQLISHELTHVVQQSANTSPGQGKMTVNDPNDQYEGEADTVAESVLNLPEEDTAQRVDDQSLQKQSMEEAKEEGVVYGEAPAPLEREIDQGEEIFAKLQRDELLEEEDPIQTKLQRDELLEEEDPLQTKLQRDELPEEEDPIQMKLQRDELPEEEDPIQTKLQRDELPEEEDPVQPELQRQEKLPDEEEEEAQRK